MANGDCVVGVENKQRIISLEGRIVDLAGVDDEQWQAINTIRNRLPAWATAIISLLTFLCGILLTVAVKK